MAWPIEHPRQRDPLIQLGWELVGAMVKRRRYQLAWTQRELAHRCGTSQAVISRLESGNLRGLKFRRFAAIVAVMGGLDLDAPAPPYRSVHPESHAPIRLDYAPPGSDLHQWLPNRDGGSWTTKDPRPSPLTLRPHGDAAEGHQDGTVADLRGLPDPAEDDEDDAPW